MFSKLNLILKNQPDFRLLQVKQLIFKNLITDWSQATNLPLGLRNQLEKECSLAIKAELFPSGDKNTIKAKITLNDNQQIESVLMKHRDGRNTVCVSCQIGCALGCRFCATGKMKFKRNLTAWEIVNQVLFFSRYLKEKKQRVSNVVFMGMGEPFLNYENVMQAIRILNDSQGLNIGSRRISISTVGITEDIEKLSQEKLQVNLAVSLHAPNDRLRSKIIPVNEKYPLKKILTAVDMYLKKTGRQVMFEYLLIKDVNDSEDCASELAKLIKKPLYFLNLILYNPTGQFQPSTSDRVSQFKMILEKHKVNFSQRYRFGDKIRAACGQLITSSQLVTKGHTDFKS